MKTGILIGIALVLCIAAVPYSSNLANIYIRPLDGRDTFYKDVGVPPREWADQYGGLSERTLIIGNLQTIPVMLRKIETLEKRDAELSKKIAMLREKIYGKTKAVDPNKVKK